MQNLGLNIDSSKVKKQSYQENMSQILQSFWLRSFHCEKYPKIGVFSDQYFPAYEQNCIIRENGGQRKPLFWYILRSVHKNGRALEIYNSPPNHLQNQSVSTKFTANQILENFANFPSEFFFNYNQVVPKTKLS